MIISLVSFIRLKKACQERKVTLMNRLVNQYKNMLYVKTDSKIGSFAGFCHHCVTITSAHTQSYRSPLSESGINYVAKYIEKQ